MSALYRIVYSDGYRGAPRTWESTLVWIRHYRLRRRMRMLPWPVRVERARGSGPSARGSAGSATSPSGARESG